jgi:hypothetical protein
MNDIKIIMGQETRRESKIYVLSCNIAEGIDCW